MKNQLAEYLEPAELELAKAVAVGKVELDDEYDLYDRLFNFYADSGRMPYGTMKARTGDPFEWITEQLAIDLGNIMCQ